MSLERILKLKGMEPCYPIIQGGMGVGVSLYELVYRVGELGGIGTVSSAVLDILTRRRLLNNREDVIDVKPYKMDFIEATRREIEDSKKQAGVVAINIMCALPLYYKKSVEGAIRGGVNMIISGAGFPLHLPSQVKKFTKTNDHEINLVPIISSARAFDIICRKWEKQSYRPDLIVLEGPKAGGHLGWSYKQIEKSSNFVEEYDLINVLLPEVLEIAEKYPNDNGPIPVIVAGGIYSHDDIVEALYNGAAGVQMGSRFAVTKESGFSEQCKQIILNAKKEDIVVAKEVWGSSCKYPFRYIKKSPLKQGKSKFFCICATLIGAAGIDNTGKKGFPKHCPEGYVLLDDNTPCPAFGTASYDPLVTCGSEAYRIDKILRVKELMTELIN